ncbi:hypothetical protein ACFO3J_24195 [Streptomyces polygonati]|uniref:Uncharacterized protein n=1 Tax=Streptomyces polygonati TaxID=1617087 RepID=A0ABV8HR68_9ACTN
MTEDDSAAPIGQVLDSLGIVATVGPDDLVAGAVVLLKVIETDGSERLSLAVSEGLGWIEKLGMIQVASTVENAACADRRADGS